MDSAGSKAISRSRERREAVNALNDCVDVLTLGYYRSFVFNKSSKRRLIRGVHGNGEDWDPMGPMGFPWEWV